MTATEDRLRRTMETILDHIGDPDGVPDQRSPPRDHHRPAEAPEHQRGGDTRRRHRPGTDSAPRRLTRWTAQARRAVSPAARPTSWKSARGPGQRGRLLGPVLWPHARAAKAIRAVFG